MSVHSVSRSESHSFSKDPVSSITLIPNMGIQGDAHSGAVVQHLSRQHIHPSPPNLRQVHLMQLETLVEILENTCEDPIKPGDLGENITTAGIDLLSLGKGSKLRFVDSTTGSSESAVVVVTGLRNPCPQIDKFRSGLKEKFIVRDSNRSIIGRRAGIMGTVEMGGDIKPGMDIVVDPPTVYEKLECV